MYLFRGVSLSPFGKIIKSNLDGFVYYLWFRILSFFTGNNIELYYLNNSILLVLPGLILYILLRVIKVNIFFAFIFSAIFIVSAANIFAIPFITKFALCIILTGFIILYRIKEKRSKLLFSVFLSAVLLYTRPEYFLTLLLTSAAYITFILKQSKVGGKRNIANQLLPLIFIAVLIIFFNPVSRHRADVAFSQHYAMDISEREDNYGSHSVPEKIMSRDFSTEYSMTEALINNPKLFFKHILANIPRLGEHIKDIFPFFISGSDYKNLQLFFYSVSVMIIIFMIYFLIERVRKKNFKIQSMIYFFFVLPSVFSILIFYPRVHYMILIFIFSGICFCSEISARLKYNSSGNVSKYSFEAAVLAGVLAGVLLIIIIPFRAGEPSIHKTNCTSLKTIFAINNLKLKNEVNFLSSGPITRAYVDKDWNFIPDNSLESPVSNFIQKNNVNLILMDDLFLNNPLLKTDSTLNTVLSDTSFAVLKIPDCSAYLLAKKNILN